MSGLELKFGGVGMVTAVFLTTRAEQDREQDGQYYDDNTFQPSTAALNFPRIGWIPPHCRLALVAYQSSSLFAALSCPLLRCDESCLCRLLGFGVSLSTA